MPMDEAPVNITANNINLPNVEEQLNRSQRELNVLYEVSCAMRTSLELDHVLFIILTGVTSHTGLGYNRAILFLVNPKLNRLECKMAIGPESGEHADKIWKYIETSKQDLDDLIQVDKISRTINQSSLYRSLKELVLPLNEQGGLLAKAYERATPWHLPPEVIAQYGGDTLLRSFPTKELVIMPLRAKGKVNGLIVADNIFTQKPIADEDIRIFTMLADQAALAIDNSRLYEMVVHKSRTDSLTNLWNHGFFQEQLTLETKNAKQTQEMLSIAIVDIDNFKKVNDTYGHQKGDVVLRELAQLFKDSSREMDFVCRYGGEEFSIILRQTNKARAFEVAERLRTKIEQYAFTLSPEDSQKVKITVSIGLATFPDNAEDKEDLIAKADKAMYIAKFSGKNRTCVAEPTDF